ncbi:hypothetical protein TanjilG_20595 [Lupinus angustifolius]|uniref:Uncharacterized protein n=1 Tax=Lupinus angustifolius TaxID=3871 RepID=A0A4P1QRA2_LUPAN|nr:PREDICTED: uncharacterized protein LOC109332304 [Lupinus angustifolius]OIV92933.1 hypothetical protein TanjilG_20595 [Lupinus angustifolius]
MGFTDLSDTDESLIDQIISEAKDACLLEQISAINCSSFTDSVLPTHLESRFHKLKSFPLTKAQTFSTTQFTSTTPLNGNHKSPDFSPSIEDPNETTEKGLEAKAKSELGSDESSNFSLFKSNPDEDKCKKQKPESGSLSSPLSISNSFMSSPSPPRKFGCFWCSPKKDSSSSKKKKKNKENWWDKSDDEFLSDLGSFSSKNQKKILKMAMKEEQKVSLEAEKIVQWAKHASARMNVLDIDDELSDH